MDGTELQNIGIMDRTVRPLQWDIENFKRRIYGFALTSCFLPTNKAIHADSLGISNGIQQ